ncbi:hypothetical protein TNCV_1543821 [Trichonephila clavipes]|nr:hypothetical protein TNCV_1543821 [Trichonephila clavipes]
MGFLERKIRQHNISSKDMLKSVLKVEWEKISAEETIKLVNSMSKRLQEVLERRDTSVLTAFNREILLSSQTFHLDVIVNDKVTLSAFLNFTLKVLFGLTCTQATGSHFFLSNPFDILIGEAWNVGK